MFRHQGKTRKFSHNLKIAILLSGVAGMVNVIGFLSIGRLTTNVTGHFAFFVDEIFKFEFQKSLVFLYYILAFLLGSFVSSVLVEYYQKRNERYIFIAPVLLEILILLIISFFNINTVSVHIDIIAISLLFSMGLQNSLVTKISNSLVRTTHLTGLFTDLGIELSQLFFYKEQEKRTVLISNIKLRLSIITGFFVGGIIAGLIYSQYLLSSLLVPSAILIIGLYYDYIIFKFKRWQH
jgi:uncharacterized membrane protein YoaK (UPF0700 family)